MAFDPIAIEVWKELQSDNVIETKASATWEHEDLAQIQIRVLRGHNDTVKNCQLCAGDTRLLSSSFDKTLLMWDVASGSVLHRYTGGHSMYINSSRANRDATRFISAGWDKRVCLWDAETATVMWSGQHGGIVMACDYSHNGRLIVTASDLDNTVRVWDSNSGSLIQELRDLHSNTVTSCYFNPTDDRLFTTSMDCVCRVWDLRTSTNTLTLTGHDNVISDSSCSADERKLATVSWDKSIKLWDISTGEFRSRGCSSIEKSHDGSVSSCEISRDGTLLVTGGYDQQVILWDVESEVQKLKLQGHTGWVEDVCFSQDQKWIVSASKDKTIRMWNIEKADAIPMVMETKKLTGLRLLSCVQCGKPYSASGAAKGGSSGVGNSDESNLCVFCRHSRR